MFAIFDPIPTTLLGHTKRSKAKSLKVKHYISIANTKRYYRYHPNKRSCHRKPLPRIFRGRCPPGASLEPTHGSAPPVAPLSAAPLSAVPCFVHCKHTTKSA